MPRAVVECGRAGDGPQIAVVVRPDLHTSAVVEFKDDLAVRIELITSRRPQVRISRGRCEPQSCRVWVPSCARDIFDNATFSNDFGQSFVATYPFNLFRCRCYAKTTESFILQ